MNIDKLDDLCALVDKYNQQRTDRLTLQKEVDKLEKLEHESKIVIIEALRTSGMSAAGGKTATVKLVIKNEPQVGNWDAFYAHIRATGEFELLYRRVNPASVKERKDVGVDVPGIDWFPVESLGLSQIK